MGWFTKDPAPDVSACLQIKYVTPKEQIPSEIERAAGNREIIMKDNEISSPSTPTSPANNAFTNNSTQTLVDKSTHVDHRSEESYCHAKENSEQADAVAELPTLISAGARPCVRESKIPPGRHLSTIRNPYTLPRLKPQHPDDDEGQQAPFENISLSGPQENFVPAHHGRPLLHNSTNENTKTYEKRAISQSGCLAYPISRPLR